MTQVDVRGVAVQALGSACHGRSLSARGVLPRHSASLSLRVEKMNVYDIGYAKLIHTCVHVCVGRVTHTRVGLSFH